MEFIEALLGLAMWVGIFYWIRSIHRKHKAEPRTFYHNFELTSDFSGKTQFVNKMCQDKKTHQVFFPDSSDPEQRFYLTDIYFSPKYETSSYTVKGKPAKRGHYVRNTVMFGLIGTAATHDKAATLDKTYTHKRQVEADGSIILKSTDLQHSYKVYFDGKQMDAAGLSTYKYNPSSN